MSEDSPAPDLVERWQDGAAAADRRDFDAVMSIFAPDAVWRYSRSESASRV
jgi:ketosteroid isomerase-like protein